MFDIVNSRDFYAMLVEDFDDYMTEQHSARRAIHCAFVAYHLHEWVWGDWLKHDYAVQGDLGIRDFRSYQDWIDRACVWFPFIRALANGGKHFGRNKNFESFRVAALPFAFDDPRAGFGMGAWDGPIRYVAGSLPVGPEGKGYLVLDLGEDAGEHRWMPAAVLIEVVVRFWRDFFRNFRPSPDLPASRHHVD